MAAAEVRGKTDQGKNSACQKLSHPRGHWHVNTARSPREPGAAAFYKGRANGLGEISHLSWRRRSVRYRTKFRLHKALADDHYWLTADNPSRAQAPAAERPLAPVRVGCAMATILPYVGNGSFDPHDIQAMSMVLDEVCKALGINGNTSAREVVASRIIELTRRGEHSPTKLRDRVLAEANGGTVG
jgi:hypothetical protein